MATNTDVLVQPLSLQRLVAFRELRMPLFQRPYQWGSPGENRDKALKYFERFLQNREANLFFGSVFVHAAHRYDYARDETVKVQLSDGQHRVVTVVLAAMAVERRLREVLADLDDDDYVDAEKALNSAGLCKCAMSGVYCVIDKFGNSEQVGAFIRRELASLVQLETEKLAVDNNYKLQCGELKGRADMSPAQRKIRKKELTEGKNSDLRRKDDSIKRIQQQPLLTSFLQLADYLSRLKPGKLLKCAENFIARVETLRVGLISLQPEQGEIVSSHVIDSEAFAMFTQMNGDATPLDEGDLFRAFAENKAPPGHPLLAFLTRNNAQQQALARFGISSPNDVAALLAKLEDPKHPDKNTYAWVMKLYAAHQPNNVLDQFASNLVALDRLNKAVSVLHGGIRSLFELYLHGVSKTTTRVVFMAKFAQAMNERAYTEVDLRSLLRILVLLELMQLYVPEGAKRPNLARDLPGIGGTERDALRFVRNHFGVVSNEELKTRLTTFLCKYPLGEPKHRKLAKLMLACADADSRGASVQMHLWATYEFEHVLPIDLSGVSVEDGLPDECLELFEEIADSANKDTTLNLLGNGALLEGSVNSRNGNASPYRKLQLTIDERHANAWWPSHLRDLQVSEGKWGNALITERTHRLVESLLAWLFSGLTSDEADALGPNGLTSGPTAAIAEPSIDDRNRRGTASSPTE